MTARVSVSSWSLHRALGSVWLSAIDPDRQTAPNPAADMALLQLPALAARHGIHTLEICHFHFPSADAGFLAELAAEARTAGVEIYSILIDDGDITAADPSVRAQHIEWIKGWIDTAGTLGASAARVIAGDARIQTNGTSLKTHEAIQMSAATLKDLFAYGQARGVRIITENFRPLALRADHLLAILELCDGLITICADFGNFKGPDRYTEFARIAPYATSGHAKAQYQEDGTIIPVDLTGGIRVLLDNDFQGPLSLIFDQKMADGHTEWDYLASMKKVAAQHLPAV